MTQITELEGARLKARLKEALEMLWDFHHRAPDRNWDGAAALLEDYLSGLSDKIDAFLELQQED
jgi:hypothetical protein